jgi:alpha-tubulin suppressor-like RCC1 family protein
VGDGTTEDRDVPTLVLGITSGTQQISEGGGGGCALTSGLAVKCWGSFDGNDFVEQTSAVGVAALPGGVASVAAGSIDGCAVSTSGSLQCWGGNGSGEVGNGTTNPQATPVTVSGLSSGVGYVAEGDNVTCAAKGKKDNLFCWGANDRGQLGDDTTTDRSTPVSIPYEAVQVSNGFDDTCTVALGGVNPDFAVCTGANDHGELGNGKMNTGVAHPVKVKSLPGTPVQVAVGGGFDGSTNPAQYACAVLTNGQVYCWGDGADGRLGNGLNTDSASPVQVSLSGPAKQVVAGAYFACALLMTGNVQCWGSDFQGELGDGGPPTSDQPTPVNVSGLSQIVQISANGGTESACALSASGTVSCWGDNSSDELGDGTAGGSSNTPQPVTGL